MCVLHPAFFVGACADVDPPGEGVHVDRAGLWRDGVPHCKSSPLPLGTCRDRSRRRCPMKERRTCSRCSCSAPARRGVGCVPCAQRGPREGAEEGGSRASSMQRARASRLLLARAPVPLTLQCYGQAMYRFLDSLAAYNHICGIVIDPSRAPSSESPSPKTFRHPAPSRHRCWVVLLKKRALC